MSNIVTIVTVMSDRLSVTRLRERMKTREAVGSAAETNGYPPWHRQRSRYASDQDFKLSCPHAELYSERAGEGSPFGGVSLLETPLEERVAPLDRTLSPWNAILPL